MALSFVTSTELIAAGVLEEDDGFTRLGDRIVLDIGSADEVVGTSAVIRVSAEIDGQTWSDERPITIVDVE